MLKISFCIVLLLLVAVVLFTSAEDLQADVLKNDENALGDVLGERRKFLVSYFNQNIREARRKRDRDDDRPGFGDTDSSGNKRPPKRPPKRPNKRPNKNKPNKKKPNKRPRPPNRPNRS